MNILELAILKKMVGGGGGSGTDNYNDLSNLPQINGETLAGNKTAENLGLQDALTFDSTPTEDSTNPVESGGVYNALAGKQDNLTFDDDPTENSTNPVKSGGVYSALAGKQDNLTFDGVYNASTNKAATESTVTNAIAGLDVSAFSLDADETISSISETDGKVSVTKQDIAIASNQVVAMTGYTKPSSAPSTPAIQTNDTANQAFGKLEFKADTTQSNILYAVNTGAWNLCPAFEDSQSAYGMTVTATRSGVTLTGTKNYADVFDFVLGTGKSTLKAGTYVFSGTASDAAYATHRIQFKFEDGSVVALDDGTTPKEQTFANDVVLTDVHLVLRYANGTSLNLALTPMVVAKQIWDTLGHNYQPPAVQNYDLTRLEAEDRAALAEEIDAGAKNKLDWANIIVSNNNATGTKTDTSLTVASASTIYGNCSFGTPKFEKASRVVFSFSVSAVTTASGSRTMVQIYSTGGASGNPITDVQITGTGKYSLEFDVPANTSYYVFIYPSRDTVKSGNTITITDLMLCTKAAFGVSSKFVPYRPNYDLVAEDVERHISIDNGSTNHASITCDVSNWKDGIYMIVVNRSQSATTRYGTSMYFYTKRSDYTLPLFTKVFEEENTKITDLSCTNTGLLTLTYGVAAYYTVKAMRV